MAFQPMERDMGCSIHDATILNLSSGQALGSRQRQRGLTASCYDIEAGYVLESGNPGCMDGVTVTGCGQ